MTSTSIALALVAGLALASIYVLIAISFTLVLSVSGVFNFAQGTIVMAGGIGSFLVGTTLGWPAIATAGLVASAGAAAGLLTHLVSIRPLVGRSHDPTRAMVLSTIGLGTVANAAIALAFGGDTKNVPSYVSDLPIYAFGIPLRPIYLAMIGCGLAVTVLLELVLRKSHFGTIFRCSLEDPEGAQLLGIETQRVIIVAFVVAGAMSGLAGYMIAPVIGASPWSATELAFYGFAGMAIGGFGSFAGALLGAVIVGLIAGLAPAVSEPYYTLPVVWLAVVAVLLWRPAGILGIAGLFGSAGGRDV